MTGWPPDPPCWWTEGSHRQWCVSRDSALRIPPDAGQSDERMTIGSDVTYWTLIADAARAASPRPLLADDQGRSLTARQFHDAACATAAAFAEHGIRAGTVVSWQLPTTLETVVVMAALARLGAVQNPIIPILREHEVGFITEQLSSEYLVVPEFWRGFDHSALARTLAATGASR